jgi:NADH:ubiquinone oxidoreductase subunit 2 (subunit N)
MKNKDYNKYFPLIFLLLTAINSVFWISCGVRDIKDGDNENILHNLTQGEIGYILSTIWVIISIINNNNEDFCQSFKKFFFLFVELVCLVLFYIICKETKYRKIIYPTLLIVTNLALFIPIFMNSNETESFPFIISFLGAIYYCLMFFQLFKYGDYEDFKKIKYIGVIGAFSINVIIVVLYFIMVFKNNEFEKIIKKNNNTSVRDVNNDNNNNNNDNFIEKDNK